MVNAKQLKAAIRQGLSLEDACSAYGISVEEGQLALSMDGQQGKSVNLQEWLESQKPVILNVLMDIVTDTAAENKDKIAAGKLLLTGEGVMPEISAGDLSERMRRFNQAFKVAGNIIDVCQPSNQLAMAS